MFYVTPKVTRNPYKDTTATVATSMRPQGFEIDGEYLCIEFIENSPQHGFALLLVNEDRELKVMGMEHFTFVRLEGTHISLGDWSYPEVVIPERAAAEVAEQILDAPVEKPKPAAKKNASTTRKAPANK